MEEYNELITTTAVNALELLYGYYLIKDSKAVDNAIGLLNSIGTLPFDLEAAVIASGIAAELASKGKMLEHMDILIASIALKYDAALVTKNVKHFSRIQKLNVEAW